MQVYLNTTKLVEIFIECDDFIKGIHDFLDAQSLPNPSDKSRNRARRMSESEMMTIVLFIIIFQALSVSNGTIILSLKSYLNPIFQLPFLILDSFS